MNDWPTTVDRRPMTDDRRRVDVDVDFEVFCLVVHSLAGRAGWLTMAGWHACCVIPCRVSLMVTPLRYMYCYCCDVAVLPSLYGDAVANDARSAPRVFEIWRVLRGVAQQ